MLSDILVPPASMAGKVGVISTKQVAPECSVRMIKCNVGCQRVVLGKCVEARARDGNQPAWAVAVTCRGVAILP
jgi:hypothetical protein